MLASFAALEARVNAAVVDRLTNAVATVDGIDVPVIFDRPFSDPFEGAVDASAPVVIGDAVALGSLVRGSELRIAGEAYRVERIEPDGAGFVRLVIYPAS